MIFRVIWGSLRPLFQIQLWTLPLQSLALVAWGSALSLLPDPEGTPAVWSWAAVGAKLRELMASAAERFSSFRPCAAQPKQRLFRARSAPEFPLFTSRLPSCRISFILAGQAERPLKVHTCDNLVLLLSSFFVSEDVLLSFSSLLN